MDVHKFQKFQIKTVLLEQVENHSWLAKNRQTCTLTSQLLFTKKNAFEGVVKIVHNEKATTKS